MNKNTFSFILILFCSTLLFHSCSLFGNGRLGYGVYEGFYAWGFETNSFRPCGSGNERWWVTAGDTAASNDLVEQYRQLTEQNPEITVYARLAGEPGKKGEYGHLGGYNREFEIKEVIEVKTSEPENCD